MIKDYYYHGNQRSMDSDETSLAFDDINNHKYTLYCKNTFKWFVLNKHKKYFVPEEKFRNWISKNYRK